MKSKKERKGMYYSTWESFPHKIDDEVDLRLLVEWPAFSVRCKSNNNIDELDSQ